MAEIVEMSADETAILRPLLEQVQHLHAQAHPDLFRADPSAVELETFLRDFVSRPAVTALACRSGEGRVDGYLIYEIQEREASTLKVAARIGFLHHVAVVEAQRGRGLGRALVEDMKARLRQDGISKVRSVHYTFNAPSAALMRATGFAPLRMVVEGEP